MTTSERPVLSQDDEHDDYEIIDLPDSDVNVIILEEFPVEGAQEIIFLFCKGKGEKSNIIVAGSQNGRPSHTHILEFAQDEEIISNNADPLWGGLAKFQANRLEIERESFGFPGHIDSDIFDQFASCLLSHLYPEDPNEY